jgi:hypothetical protein
MHKFERRKMDHETKLESEVSPTSATRPERDTDTAGARTSNVSADSPLRRRS